MTDAPRTIHVHPLNDGGPCDGWDFEGWWYVDPNANGPGERYHHDAVVRELVEAAQQMMIEYDEVDIADGEPPSLVAAVFALRAALAKIAQESPND